jgi:mannan endo-1,4-beta-mannosidase
LEHDAIGTFDDEVLNRLDDVMFNANAYGIKLLISIHSFNALQAGDVYGKTYNTQTFYTDSNALASFNNRIWWVLSHVNPHNGKAWKDCSEYIFAFEAQNEAMNDDVSPQTTFKPV